MSERYVASVDQGTASSRCIVFDERSRIVAVSQVEHEHIFPRPGHVEHDPAEIWRNVEHVVADALASAGLRAPRPRRARHHEPARDHRAVGPGHRRAGAQRAQLAGHADGPSGARARRRRGLGPLPRPLRAAARDLLLRPEDPLAARPRRRARGARGDGRGAVRDDRLVADLEPHRPPHHRRHERRPHDADEPRDARLGRRPARRDGRAARDAAGDPAVDGGLRRGGRRARRPARRGGARRPARGAVRPDVLRAGRRQVHLRHRQLPADEHRRAAGRRRPTGCSPRSATRSAASRRRTRSRARSRSPARSCSGSATRSG